MDAGKLKERIELLRLDENKCWMASKLIWSSATHKDRTNIFAKSGLGAATVEFIIRRQPVTLQNAIRWDGKHCMITSITEPERGYLKLTTAVVQLYDCRASRPVKVVENHKPRVQQQPMGDFQATLTEKYQRSYQAQPQTVTEVTRILVTPKAIMLQVADLVTIGGATYVVVAEYTLAEHCNEYELLDKREA